MNLLTIGPDQPFLDAIATDWLARAGKDPLAAANGLILLPTRRAARSLTEAFLAHTQGRPTLLPRITAFGALDESPLAMAGSLALPPAVPGPVRLAHLARLIMALDGRAGAPATADRAWPLAVELAALMDEAERAEVDLRDALPRLAAEDYAEHWAITLRFLQIVTAAWPAWLADNGLMNPAARQVALLDAQARSWTDRPPLHPVLAAGSTGGIPAVARLLRVVAEMPGGRVVLPGLDLTLAEPAWEALEDSHPQAGLRRLLTALGARRGDVEAWEAPSVTPPERVALLNRALLPAIALGEWRAPEAHVDGRDNTNTVMPGLDPGTHAIRLVTSDAHSRHSELHSMSRQRSDAVDGRIKSGHDGGDTMALLASGRAGSLLPATLWRLTAADQQEEAVAIALLLRRALDVPDQRAALVTPDRDLAGRVAAELGRFGVVADDSAGEPLACTPPAVFLRLLAAAVAEQFRPVPLLALLKHPLAAAGLSTAACRAAARRLERDGLRGPAPKPGLSGLQGVARSPAALRLLDALERCLAPLSALAATERAAPNAALAALIAAAEALAATPDETGADRLWSGEDGQALAVLLAEVMPALAALPPQDPATFPGLLDEVLAGAAVRSRRALRGRTGAEHPRIFIWGLLEARLQHADLIVLGGLAEGVWPAAADPGPWLSRPMRAAAGLPSPEELVGQMAHDWVMTACAAPEVVLSCSRRRDSAPAVPARWLQRLEAMLRGSGSRLPEHPAAAWARALDLPAGPVPRLQPPAPRPPVAVRPRRLRVTEIETWLRDPYAIYARHILRLRALPPIEEPADAADYGSVVHAAVHAFLADIGTNFPPDAERRLCAAMDAALADADLRPALAAWWRPRLQRIAAWVAGEEAERRLAAKLAQITSEQDGEWLLPTEPPFVLAGRADRIERRPDTTLAILDYKTGTPPSNKDVESGLAPQLPLEAAMAEAGAFGAGFAGSVAELTYWHLTGGHIAGKVQPVLKKPGELPAAIARARSSLAALIAAFDDPEHPYLSQPHPGRAPRFSDYTQLARVAEWAALEDTE